MTPIEILEDAEDKLDVFRNPDIQDARDIIDEILKVSKLNSFGLKNATITSITILKDYIFVTIADYYNEMDTYNIPLSIFEAEDYILETKKYYSAKRLEQAKSAYGIAECALNHAKKQLEKAQNELIT